MPIRRAKVDDVLDLSDPFDGFTRGMPVAPFLPAVLAACGIATVSNGAESIVQQDGDVDSNDMQGESLVVSSGSLTLPLPPTDGDATPRCHAVYQTMTVRSAKMMSIIRQPKKLPGRRLSTANSA
jgi:hypothetical protein